MIIDIAMCNQCIIFYITQLRESIINLSTEDPNTYSTYEMKNLLTQN